MYPLRGITLKLAAVMCFIVMISLIKAADVPSGEAVFFRSFFAIPVILVWVMIRGDLGQALKVRSVTAHALRGALGTLAMLTNFAAIVLLPLPEATALGYAMPLLVVVFAAMFLHEKVGLFRFGAVGLGLFGVLVVMEPSITMGAADAVETAQLLGVALALFGATCGALAQVHIRNMVQVEQTSAIVFFFSLTASVLALLTLPFGWDMPQGMQWVYLISCGLLGGLGQIFLTSSYRFADASLVAPFDYASMIFAVLIGYFWFDEVPGVQTLIGAAIVIAAGIVIILRERYLGLQRGKARQAKNPFG
ncbi:DMT family transporter [Pseudooceanicola nanhaiensis]|jgi:drug/metabolite transporter (DMT)-like permease|uniref:Transporter RarD family, DMT superfamily protein n=1 Tax=Pseudooceanicola nanhaiensis TaxID=375761 RepID=A0A917WHS6_9RHOB|nr:DMT family transporter [Pseudooceanicola nanhaiensis]GGM07386.1 transporter RarD family, DMT superfamily protein [Pseudooceanicola nanhaiensis]